MSYELRQLAQQHHVHLLKFPSHLTHLLQPLDVAVFKPLKSAWGKVVQDYTRRERSTITKRLFPSLLAEACKNGYKPDAAVAGFKKCGIHPFNVNIIPSYTFSLSHAFTHSDHQTSPADTETPANTETPADTEPPADIETPVMSVAEAILCTPPAEQLSLPTDISHSSDQLPSSISVQSPPLSQPQGELSHTPTSGEAQVSLRDYFGELLRSCTPHRSQQRRRHRLVGFGESMTSEEALQRVRREEEEKQRKEEEKEERRKQREAKKRERETKLNKRSKKKTDNDYFCLECQGKYREQDNGDQWIECESCLGWAHQSCANFPGLTHTQLMAVTYVCSTCEDTDIVC